MKHKKPHFASNCTRNAVLVFDFAVPAPPTPSPVLTQRTVYVYFCATALHTSFHSHRVCG
eukprot:2211267-Rhodomonas_salina.1